MRAARYRRNGPSAEVLEVVELDLPEPGPGEVRVRIVASGINTTDWKTRAGLANRVPDGFQIRQFFEAQSSHRTEGIYASAYFRIRREPKSDLRELRGTHSLG